MLRLCALTANLCDAEVMRPHTPQELGSGITLDYHVVTDAEMPPRHNNMSGRIASRIPKCFAWQMRPGYDVYIWHDASFTFYSPDAVRWLVNQLVGHEFVCYRHPFRTSIQQEADFLATELPRSWRLMKRYRGENADGLLREIHALKGYADDRLYAAGIFAYHDQVRVHEAMKDWWYFTSRYHHNDQLSLPYVLWKHALRVAVIDGDIYHDQRIIFTRNRPWPVGAPVESVDA